MLKNHLEKLIYFYEVAASGSIKKASNKLNLTQPTVSKSIKILEDSIGKALFVRLPRGVMLTQEGDALYSFCHDFFSRVENIEKQLLNIGKKLSGSIRIGTYESIAIYFWPQFLLKFTKDFPEIDIQLVTGRSAHIQKMVETGELDMGLIVQPRMSSVVDRIILVKDTFRLYRSAKMPLAKALKSNTPLIYMPDAMLDSSEKHLNYLSSLEYKDKKHFKTSGLESAKELIISGVGIGFLPIMVARDALKKRQIVEIKRGGDSPIIDIGFHEIGLIYPKLMRNKGLVEKVVSQIKKEKWT